MKLHLPKGLRNAVMACLAAVSGITATCATATLATGVATIVLAATPAALATDYTPGDITDSTTLSNPDVINLDNNASIGSADNAATLHFAEDNEGITLNVGAGSDSIWHVSESSITENAGVSIVNISENATLSVYNSQDKFTAFNNKTMPGW